MQSRKEPKPQFQIYHFSYDIEYRKELEDEYDKMWRIVDDILKEYESASPKRCISVVRSSELILTNIGAKRFIKRFIRKIEQRMEKREADFTLKFKCFISPVPNSYRYNSLSHEDGELLKQWREIVNRNRR